MLLLLLLSKYILLLLYEILDWGDNVIGKVLLLELAGERQSERYGSDNVEWNANMS